jgi:hypothetical protein
MNMDSAPAKRGRPSKPKPDVATAPKEELMKARKKPVMKEPVDKKPVKEKTDDKPVKEKTGDASMKSVVKEIEKVSMKNRREIDMLKDKLNKVLQKIK